MMKADDSSVIGDFDNKTVTFHDIVTKLSRTESGTYQVETLGLDGQELFDVAYIWHYPAAAVFD